MKIIKSFICNIQVKIKKNYTIRFQLFNPILFYMFLIDLQKKKKKEHDY